ncbi:unnamed protein product, partial [Adineta steineri]
MVRTYDYLSTFRLMKKETDNIDFVVEFFKADFTNTETLLVVLNELITQVGDRLTFTNKDFAYDDSAYRTVCGVSNLGSVHSLLAGEGNIQSAKFALHLSVDCDGITKTPKKLREFVLTNLRRVFDIRRTSSIMLGFGITMPDMVETKHSAEFLEEKLNESSIRKRNDIFKDLFSEDYGYTLEPVIRYLQLHISDLEPSYNRDYPFAEEATRGEWAVGYHGIGSSGVKGIVDKGLLHNSVAYNQNPSITNVQGFRVQPGKFTEHTNTAVVSVGKVWRVFDETAIRLYGLLLK